MKLKEMIEIIKEAHPEVSDQRIIKLLNQANIEFSSDTRRDVNILSSISGQEYWWSPVDLTP